jgi:ribonuclease BN (tRNA processing enzyme)
MNWNVKVMYSKAGVATQILISTTECDVLVDAGDGTLRDLLELDYDFERLKAIAITHGHFDHVGGLWALLGFLRMIGRTNDLFLIAPPSCSEIENLVKIFTAVYSDTMPFQIISKVLSNEEKFNIARIEAQAFFVIHRGAIKVFGIGNRIPALHAACMHAQLITTKESFHQNNSRLDGLYYLKSNAQKLNPNYWMNT